MRVFLLRNAASSIYPLSSKEKNYLFNVLRLKVNDVFTAKDSEERYYKAFLFDGDTITLEPSDNPEETLLDGLSSYRGPFIPISMFVSVLKGRRNEIEARALTEMGVKRIILMETEFTQEKLKEHSLDRIKAIIREAVQQSGSREPELIGPVSFKDAVDLADGVPLLLHQSILSSTSSLSEILEKGKTDAVSAFIGPEGGFSGKECVYAEEKGLLPVLLNTSILRSETAAIYTAAAIQAILQN